MTGLYTTVPDVRGHAYDDLLPTAIAGLPATIIVGGETVDLDKPQLFYGLPDTQNPPSSCVSIAGASAGDVPVTVFPVSQLRPHDEEYTLEHLIWYRIGDLGDNAQRIATESAWTVYRAIFAAYRGSSAWSDILTSPFSALVTKVSEREFALAEGRAAGIAFDLTIRTRV